MLTADTKRKIDYLRDALVGKIPVPSQQIEQITLGLIYKFMSDIDEQNEELGGKSFFSGEYKKYSWKNIMDRSLAGHQRVLYYEEGLEKMSRNKELPQLFRDIFKGAFLPFKDPAVLDLFLKGINEFKYEHSEELGNAFEYLLSTAASQGDAGQFRTPRHIIDFIVEVVDPQKEDRILDPACGTAGFLVSAYKHILKNNTDKKSGRPGSLLTATERKKLTKNIVGYDISHEMVRLSLVNLYLHGFAEPNIYEYDTLSSLERWDDNFDCLLANPPFMTPRGGIKPHNRFPIQAKRSEVLFVDYITEHLTPNGKAGIIVPDGIIFKGDTAYKQLRKMLVEDGLWAVVSLPAGVFNPYSGVQTSILFFCNPIARQTKEILFINVGNDGFDLGAQRRPIDKNDLPTRLEVLKKYKKAVQENKKFSLSKDEEKFANVVKKEKIAKDGNYNLSANRYKEIVNPTNQKWPMIELAGALDYEQPTKYIVNSVDYNDKYTTPVLTAGKTFILGYTNEKEGIFKEELPVIIFDDFTTAMKLVDFPFKVKSSAMKILRPKKNIADVKFLYYVMQKIKFTNSKHKRYWISEYSKIKIPLPPIEIQEQIVAEIDNYQKVVDGARQIIDNYKPTIKNAPNWKNVPLGEVCDIFNGSTPLRSRRDYWENGSISWFTVDDIREQGRIITHTKQKITEKALQDTSVKLLPEKTVLLCCTASVGEYAFTKIKLTTNQQFNGLVVKKECKDKLLPEFLFWLSSTFKNELIRLSGKTSFSFLPIGTLKTIKIPLPSVQVQNQIIEQIGKEQKAIETNKELIKLFEQKIKDKISEVWGE
jgi:type I restriction enzyme M protein